MTMIEKVARAIAKDVGWDWDALPFGQADWTAAHWTQHRIEYTGMHRSDFLDAARAAIEAMKEPDEVMALEGCRQVWDMAEKLPAADLSTGMWRAMIAAALEDQP